MVRLKSGETYSDCTHALGAMTADDVNEKVRRMIAVAGVTPERCARLVTAGRNLEELDDVSDLVPLLVC